MIESHPAFAAAWYRLGQIASSRGDYEQAIRCQQKCVEASPANEGALDQLAALHQHLEHPEEPQPRQALVKAQALLASLLLRSSELPRPLAKR